MVIYNHLKEEVIGIYAYWIESVELNVKDCFFFVSKGDLAYEDSNTLQSFHKNENHSKDDHSTKTFLFQETLLIVHYH